MSQYRSMELDDLQELLWGFASHRVITVAGRTGVLGRLARGPATSDEVASDLDLEPEATCKVIRALTALGLAEQAGGGYRLGEGMAPLFAEGADDLTAFLQHSHHLYERWGESLEPWLRGEAWPTMPRDDEAVHRFGAAMRAMGMRVAAQVAQTLDLSGVDRVLDVGGGYGHYARALCRAREQLRATVLDLPDVAEMASRAPSPDARIDFVGGDYLSSDYGEGYDLVLFANVLHQENPQRAAEMVRRGAGALAPGGRVAVVDFAIHDDRHGPLVGVLFAINMRSFGDTHTEPTIRRWMETAGLRDVTRTDLGRHRWIVEGWRA